ncbi:MAG: polymerase sigma-70 factor, subfamily [Acidobacteriota bacterium]|jgi:RNA polymerase sigma-70 factor (ECF subfamily)|nr:polymerase sigma-70 factor, subfamily [Acidobacteriota bacterium]MDT7778762.1 polymerase sigma-70 factor, subfamily [Acidobacteriota bacterium]
MKVRSLNLFSGAKGLSLSNPQTDAEDAGLLHATARGDEGAFAQVYDRYSPILFGLLLRILRSRSEAEDVLQEVFLQVWQQARSFDAARGRAFTWLVTLARSRAIDRLRSVDSRERAAQRSAEDAPPASEGQEWADTAAIRAERAEAVQGALAELPEEQRQVLVLAYLEGMSQSEIAVAKNQPLGTVKTRTRSGLKKLSEALSARLGRSATSQ